MVVQTEAAKRIAELRRRFRETGDPAVETEINQLSTELEAPAIELPEVPEPVVVPPPTEVTPLAELPKISRGLQARTPLIKFEQPAALDVPTLLQNIYPNMFDPEASFGISEEELPQVVAERIGQFILEDPDAFLDDLRSKGDTPDTRALLRILGEGEITDEEISDFFEDVLIPQVSREVRTVETIVADIDGVRTLVGVDTDGTTYDERGNFIGYYNFGTNEVWNPYKAEGIAGKTLNSFVAGVGDIFVTSGGTARWLGFDDAGAQLSTVGAELQKFGVPSSGAEFEAADLLNPEFYATKITRTIPFALSLAPLAIGGFYGGTAIGTAVGLGRVGAWIIGGIGGAALSRPAESALEAGAQYDDAISRGKTETEAKAEADEVFRKNLVLAGLDAWQIAIALAPTPKWVPASLVKSGLVRVARIGGKMIIVGLSEGGEEVYQDMISRHARGETWQLDPISKEVFAIGAVMGAGMGLGGDVISGIVNRSKDNMAAKIKTQFDETVSQLKNEGLNTDEAELVALNKIAETIEGERLVKESISEQPEVTPAPITEAVKPVAEVPEVVIQQVPSRGIVPATRPFEIRLTPEELVQVEGSAFHGTGGREILGILDSGFIETSVSRGDVLGEDVVSLSKFKAAADNIFIIEVKDPGFRDRGEAIRGDVVPPGLEVVSSKAIPISDIKSVIISIGSRESLATKELVTGQTLASIKKQIEAKGIKVIVEQVRPPAVEEVTPVAPEKGVARKATDVNEVIPPDVITEPVPKTSDSTPNVNDIGIIEQARPARKVFEKMGIFDIWEDAFKAETLLGEEQTAFNKELNKHAKAVNKEAKKLGLDRKVRRELIWEYVNNNNQEAFNKLTFPEKQAALWWKRTADDWANRLNIPAEKRIKNYIPHIFDEAIRAGDVRVTDASLSMMFSEKITDKVNMPFLKERTGVETGLVKDPFLAAQAYQNVALRKFYYEPILQKLKLISEHETTPPSAKNYLKAYSRRMTGEPSNIDREINRTLLDLSDAIRKIPKSGKAGVFFADLLSQGNPSGMAAYNLTSSLYVLWLGFKPTTAIRNISQHGLIIADVDSIQDFGNGIRLRFTKEGRDAIAESLVWRSRRGAFIESIDSSFQAQWTDKFRETALFLFRKADEQNVKDAFLSGYAEAKRLFPEQDRKLWIDRGDEVAMDTQYLYTKMNSMAISQNGPGKVGAMLTTWAFNWLELMNKFARGRGSRVYRKLVESPTIILTKDQSGVFSLPKRNWLKKRQSLILYMTIVGLAYGLNEQDWNRVRAFEYTGFTSIGTFANLVGGEFPALQLAGAVADIVTGTLLGNERDVTAGFNQLKRSFSILNQVKAVAEGERDWLTLLFYLEGKDKQVRALKEDWEKNWEVYDEITEDAEARAKLFPTLPKNTALKRWREQHPKIEAQMFITNKLSTLSSDEARTEAERLIEKHNIDTDVINGWEKIFGVDTTVELAKFQTRIGSLEKFRIDEEAKYFTTSSFLAEVNRMVEVNGRDKVERDGHKFAIFVLGQQDSWQPYEDYEPGDARTLYRQLNPDVEASLYMFDKIQSFKNPESAAILLRWMKEFNIPPQAIPAFNENPDKYDELFTQKFELEQKSFELDTRYENLGNSESDIFIEDKEERKLAREKLKEDNPDWVADQRRIEAIDNDASKETIDKWADRGKVVDEFSPNSSESQAWLLDNPDVHKWALDNELLTDDGSDWNENTIRMNVKWRKTDETYNDLPVEGDDRENFLLQNPEYNDDRRRRTMYGLDASDELVSEFVEYGHVVDVFSSGSSQAKLYRFNHSGLNDFGTNKDTLDWEELKESDVPIWVIDVRYEAEDNEYQAILDKFEDNIKQAEATNAFLLANPEYHKKRFERDALKIDFPLVEEYVQWHTDPKLVRPPDLPSDIPFYEDDWYLMEHPSFYSNMLTAKVFTKRRDFRLVPMKNGLPDRVVGRKYVEYLSIRNNQAARDQFRLENPDMDTWGVGVGIWIMTMSERRKREGQTPSETFQEDVAGDIAERERILAEIERLQD